MDNDTELDADVHVERVIICYQNLESKLEKSKDNSIVDDAVGAAVGSGMADSVGGIVENLFSAAQDQQDKDRDYKDVENPTEVLGDSNQ